MTLRPSNSLSSNKDTSGVFGLYLTATGLPSACFCNFSAVYPSSAMRAKDPNRGGHLPCRHIRAECEKERTKMSLPLWPISHLSARYREQQASVDSGRVLIGSEPHGLSPIQLTFPRLCQAL